MPSAREQSASGGHEPSCMTVRVYAGREECLRLTSKAPSLARKIIDGRRARACCPPASNFARKMDTKAIPGRTIPSDYYGPGPPQQSSLSPDSSARGTPQELAATAQTTSATSTLQSYSQQCQPSPEQSSCASAPLLLAPSADLASHERTFGATVDYEGTSTPSASTAGGPGYAPHARAESTAAEGSTRGSGGEGVTSDAAGPSRRSRKGGVTPGKGLVDKVSASAV